MPACKICFLINLLVCISAFSQGSTRFVRKEKPVLASQMKDTSAHQSLLRNALMEASTPATHIKVLPQQFYFNSLGFFCKKELQLQKSVKLPLKIRLGSVSYTDRMEGKGQSLIQKVRGTN
jgi:hypothetical protein